MLGKSKLFIAMLLATTVVPYMLSNSSGWRNMVGQVWPAKSDSAAPADAAPAQEAASVAPVGHVAGETGAVKPAARPDKTPVHPLEDALRFDVTTAWVLSNWPRVSAGLAELDLQGYRVPLVTGTSDADVAGSLTYYFNPQQRVARITFFGTTGDTRKLVALLESRYGFKRIVTPEPNLFVYQAKTWTYGKVTSELRMRPAPVVRSDLPHSRFEVALLMDRPKSMD